MDVIIRTIVFIVIGGLVIGGILLLKLPSNIKKVIGIINKCYKKVTWSGGKFIGVLISILEILVSITIVLEAYVRVTSMELSGGILMLLGAGIFLIVLTWLTMYFIFGVILFLFEKATNYIIDIEDTKINNWFLISLLLLGTIAFLIQFPVPGVTGTVLGNLLFAMGIVVSYFLNFNILLKVIQSPESLIRKQDRMEDKSKSVNYSLVFGTVLLILMTIFDFSLGVWMLNDSFSGEYSGSLSNLIDCIYYVTISFTTIGYGDVTPLGSASRALAVIISITSVVYLIIFINVVAEHIKKNSNNANIVVMEEKTNDRADAKIDAPSVPENEYK